MSTSYDAIVIGARCAGSPTAMLLARGGHRVLLVDRATFPSDTVSTHVLHPPAGAALARWGLLDRLTASGCPPIHSYDFDFGPLTISGRPGTDGAPPAYCPRRTVLDELLVDAAGEAGVEVREGFVVDQILSEGGRVTGIRGHSQSGGSVTERARVVVGADGRHSPVAAAVQAPQYDEKPPLMCGYYSYWSDLPMDGRFETYIRPLRGFAAAETHDGLTLVIVGWPAAEFAENRKHVEQSYLGAIGLVPAFAERLRAAKRQAPFVGATVPTSSGSRSGRAGLWWATPATTGTSSPRRASWMRSPERRRAPVRWIRRSGAPVRSTRRWASTSASATARIGHVRIHLPAGDAGAAAAELRQLLAAIHGNQPAMDAFVRMNAGTISPAEFFAPQNVGAMVAGSAAGR